VRCTIEKVWKVITDSAETRKYFFGFRIEADWKWGAAHFLTLLANGISGTIWPDSPKSDLTKGVNSKETGNEGELSTCFAIRQQSPFLQGERHTPGKLGVLPQKTDRRKKERDENTWLRSTYSGVEGYQSVEMSTSKGNVCGE
jgi:hypothetical protein